MTEWITYKKKNINCTECVFCVKKSARDYADPYNGNKAIHIDCWENHTWHDAEKPCEKFTTEI